MKMSNFSNWDELREHNPGYDLKRGYEMAKQQGINLVLGGRGAGRSYFINLEENKNVRFRDKS